MDPDLAKQRRFALAIGLVGITYALAGVELIPGEEVRPLGIPFNIQSPELLPIGLLLASAYGGLRFLYWAAMRSESPTRARRPYRVAKKKRTGPWKVEFENRVDADDFLDAGRRLFPRTRASAARVHYRGMNVGTASGGVEAEIVSIQIPRTVNLLARIDEVDYFAPVWLNAIAAAALAASIFVTSP